MPDAAGGANAVDIATPLEPPRVRRDGKCDMKSSHHGLDGLEGSQRTAPTERPGLAGIFDFPDQAFHAVIAPSHGGPHSVTPTPEFYGAAQVFEYDTGRAQI